MAQKPAKTGLRSQYALRLYAWAKNYVKAGTASISLERPPKGSRPGVDQRFGRKRHSGTAFADLGELPPESVGYCDRGDQ